MKNNNRLLALIVLPLCWLLAACEEEAPEVVEEIRSIKTITVSERGSGRLRKFPGILEAVDTSSLSFEVGGNTREVNVNVGDQVEEGQVLATLDKTPFQISVEGAEAERGRAKAQLAEKDTDYVRQRTLFEKGWVAEAAYDQATAARDSASNQVSFKVSQLNLARRDLEKTVLVAPYKGVIASKFIDPFQEVARGEKVFEMYAEGAMEVVVTIPENAIADIYLGLPAEITFPAERVPAQKGRVSEVGTVASEANAFPVKVALLDPPDDVLPGMTAEASMILGADAENVSYLVPVSALVGADEPGTGFIFVFDPATSTVVKTKIRGASVRDNRVVVAEGIEAGDVIAVAGASFLRDGQKVKLMSK